MNAGDTVTVNGQQVRVLSVDSDPAAQVWGVLLSNPDQSVWFLQSDCA